MMGPDRIFLDADILFSIAYGSAGPDRLWDLAKEGRCTLIVSEYVVEEARRNLNSPVQIKRLEEFLSDVQKVLEADPSMPCPVNLPEKDRPVLMAAIFNHADFFITGDLKHFKEYFGKAIWGVRVLMLRDYFT